MLTRRHTHSDEEQWAPISDLMAVTMLIFMLIAILLIVNFHVEKKINSDICEETRDMLETAFEEDFKNWEAELYQDLTIRFTNQRVLFDSDSATIKPWFADKLQKFFPRYMGIIKDIRKKFGEYEVLEVGIEGHTSTEYENPGDETPYIRNMELSQNRAREILKYVLSPIHITESLNYGNLARRLTTASGLSSRQLICTEDNQEDTEASRRVEFKLLTNSCQKAGIYKKAIPLARKCSITESDGEPK